MGATHSTQTGPAAVIGSTGPFNLTVADQSQLAEEIYTFWVGSFEPQSFRIPDFKRTGGNRIAIGVTVTAVVKGIPTVTLSL
jgi:hypothetical protein